MNSRSLRALVWTVIIIAGGLLVRRAPLHLPSLQKYGGSVLWGAMVYAIFVALFPKRRPLGVGLGAWIFALLVELFKLVHTPGLDGFRLTLAGQLLLGRYFSLADIVAYWAAIAAFAFWDDGSRKRAAVNAGLLE